MAFSDLYEVIDKQSVGPVQAFNIYQVERVDPVVDAVQIGNAFEVSILPALLPLQTLTVIHEEVTIRSLDNPLDFHSFVPSPNAGTRVGDAAPQFNAASIQFNRTRTDMKNGQKRFFAGTELDQSNAIWSGPFITEVEVLGQAIVDDWFVGVAPPVSICRYVIIKRVCTVDPPPDPCPSYRLPESDAELVQYRPLTFIARQTVRSQTSRKRLI